MFWGWGRPRTSETAASAQGRALGADGRGSRGGARSAPGFLLRAPEHVRVLGPSARGSPPPSSVRWFSQNAVLQSQGARERKVDLPLETAWLGGSPRGGRSGRRFRTCPATGKRGRQSFPKKNWKEMHRSQPLSSPEEAEEPSPVGAPRANVTGSRDAAPRPDKGSLGASSWAVNKVSCALRDRSPSRSRAELGEKRGSRRRRSTLPGRGPGASTLGGRLPGAGERKLAPSVRASPPPSPWAPRAPCAPASLQPARRGRESAPSRREPGAGRWCGRSERAGADISSGRGGEGSPIRPIGKWQRMWRI